MTTDQGTPGLPSANVALSPRQRLAGSPLLPVFDRISSMLAAGSGRAPDDPVAAPYVDAIREQGRQLHRIGGADAMKTVLDLVTAGVPQQAYARRRFVEAAWDGLPGWTSTTGATR